MKNEQVIKITNEHKALIRKLLSYDYNPMAISNLLPYSYAQVLKYIKEVRGEENNENNGHND